MWESKKIRKFEYQMNIYDKVNVCRQIIILGGACWDVSCLNCPFKKSEFYHKSCNERGFFKNYFQTQRNHVLIKAAKEFLELAKRLTKLGC